MAAGANPAFKHYGTNTIPAATVTTVGSVTPAARTLLVSKLTVCNIGTPVINFALYVGPVTATNNNLIAYNISLNQGEVYTETGLVVPAAEAVQIYVFGAVANIVTVNVFGEEVDAT